MTVPEQALITQAEADQLFLALVGTRVNATSMQNFVAQRLQGLSLAGLTSGLGPQTRNGRVYKGLNAGAFEPQTGLWVNASGSYVDDSRPGSAQDGWGGSAAIGGDVIFDSTVLGEVTQLQGQSPVEAVLIFRVSPDAMTLQGESECRPAA